MHDKAVSKACTAYIDTDTMDQAVSMRAAIRAFLASVELSAGMCGQPFSLKDERGYAMMLNDDESRRVFRAMSAKLADELGEK